MCLYPKRMINKKYTCTEKNGGNIPFPPVIGIDEYGNEIYDERVLYTQIPCGQCIECRQQKAREWQVRLGEEIKEHNYNYFITLTFGPKELAEVKKKSGLSECNALAAYATRHMLERWRKKHKKSLKHWLITELGHEGTERIHMHGMIFSDEQLQFAPGDENNMVKWEYWKYGHIFVGTYCNQATVNYIVKYINKIDNDHKGFVGQILCSPGLGKNWIEGKEQLYRYRPKNSIDYYVLNNGCRVKLPKYYKNKLYTEEEREKIWREFMDKNEQTIAGITYSTNNTSNETIGNITEKAQEVNKFLGFGDDSKEWRKKKWNITKRMLQQIERKKQMDLMAAALAKNAYNQEKNQNLLA